VEGDLKKKYPIARRKEKREPPHGHGSRKKKKGIDSSAGQNQTCAKKTKSENFKERGETIESSPDRRRRPTRQSRLKGALTLLVRKS